VKPLDARALAPSSLSCRGLALAPQVHQNLPSCLARRQIEHNRGGFAIPLMRDREIPDFRIYIEVFEQRFQSDLRFPLSTKQDNILISLRGISFANVCNVATQTSPINR